MGVRQSVHMGHSLPMHFGSLQRCFEAVGFLAQAGQKLVHCLVDGCLQGSGTNELGGHLKFEASARRDPEPAGRAPIRVRLGPTSRVARLTWHVGAPVYTETRKLSFSTLGG